MTGEPEAPPQFDGPPQRRRVSRRALWLGGGAGVAALALAILFAARMQLADRLIVRELARADVDASYRIERLGLTHQRLVDVVIGDPARPDLVAREVDIWLGYGWSGPRIDRVRLRGALVRGRYDGERLRLGQLDRLLPAPTDEPLELPDLGLDVADSAALIATPWGLVAAGAVLDGNPLRAMTGEVALRAPALRHAGCALDDLRLRTDVRSDGADLRLIGPVRARRVDCPGQGVAARDGAVNANVTLPVGLTALRWSGDFAAAAVAAPNAGAAQLSGRSEGRWSLTNARGSGFVSARTGPVAAAGVAAGGAALRGDFAHADGRWRFTGGAAVARASLPPAWRGLGEQLRAQRQAPLLGPLLADWGAALDTAGRSFGIAAPIRIDAGAGLARLSLPSAQLRSASGASLALRSGDRVLGWDGTRLTFGGDFRFGGGGFPALSGRIDRRRDGSFALALTPFRAANASAALAVDRLGMDIDPAGNGRFVAAAGLSGPVAGGRVDGLALPLAGRIAGGRVSIDGGCRDLRYAAIAVSTTRFGPGRLSACPLPGQPLLAFGNGPLQGGLRTGAFALNGRSGTAPLLIRAAGLRYALASGTGELAGLSLTLGEGVGATRFAAERITAMAGRDGWGGELAGGSGQIGSVPLAMSAINGPWRWRDGALTLTGRLAVTDTAAPERFTPMSVEDATLSWAGDRIEATGSVRNPASPAPLATLTLAHNLGAGRGSADFTLVPLRFVPDGLQPQALTPLALGVVANVDGTVTGSGRIVWTPDGVSSTGRFATDDTDLAAAFGPVAGLAGTIEFDDLLGLTTPPGQTARVASINPGIEVTDGVISYQMLLNRRVRIEGGQWPFAGGTLRLLPGLIDYAAEQPRYLNFDVEGIDAARFLERYGFENITATGVFDGVIPTIFDGNGGRVVGGTLVVRDGGGSLAYVGELTNRDLGYFGNLAFGALRSLEYESLIIRLNGNIDGEMLTEVGFTGLGQGPGAQNNFLTRQIARLPFAFNIRINAPFRQLLTSARSLYDPTILIDQNLPALVAAEAAERERQARERARPPVQQQESGNPPQERQE